MTKVYNLEVTNEITNHFEQILQQDNSYDIAVTLKDVKLLLTDLKNSKQEDYVTQRIEPLENMLQMFIDNQWHMSQSNKHYIAAAFNYLIEVDNLIPDTIPVIGLLDDCIVIDIVMDKIAHELKNYQDFSHSRKVYAKDNNFAIADWNKIKTIEASSIRRNRRNKRSSRNTNKSMHLSLTS